MKERRNCDVFNMDQSDFSPVILAIYWSGGIVLGLSLIKEFSAIIYLMSVSIPTLASMNCFTCASQELVTSSVVTFLRTKLMPYVEKLQRTVLWEPTPESIVYWILMRQFHFKLDQKYIMYGGLKQVVVCSTSLVLLLPTSSLPPTISPKLQKLLFNISTNDRASAYLPLTPPS